MTPVICVTCRYGAPPDRVFEAWLDPGMARKWLFATASRPMARAAIDARVGGTFCFVDRHDGGDIEYAGEYVEITRPRRLIFTLRAQQQFPRATRVVVEIAALKTGCRLNLTHDDVPPEDAQRAAARWTGILYGLGVTLNDPETGARDHGQPRGMRPLSKSGSGKRLERTESDINRQETRRCDS